MKNEIVYKLKKFLKGNGFYLALGLSLVAVLTLAVTTAGGDVPEPELPENSQTESLTPAGKDESKIYPDEEPSTPENSESEDEPESSEPIPSEPEPEPEPEPDRRFYLPMETDVMLEYSENTLVFSPTTGDYRTHLAVDFEGVIGAKVKAVSYGKVIDIYDDELYGKTVVIEHGEEVFSRYSGIRNVAVEMGETVDGKTVIGELSGFIPIEEKDGTHLHFEIINNGERVNPMDLFEVAK